MSKELFFLLLALAIILASIVFWNQNLNCYTIEYQNQQGNQTHQICKGKNGND
jgi:hypothetical protein